jgi:hypothetical protein
MAGDRQISGKSESFVFLIADRALQVLVGAKLEAVALERLEQGSRPFLCFGCDEDGRFDPDIA